MQRNQLLRVAFRVLSGSQEGKEAKPGDIRYLRSSAPELELTPDFIARYIIEREMRKKSIPAPKASVRASAAG